MFHVDWNAFASLAAACGTVHWIVARAKITARFWRLNWCRPAPLRSFFDALLTCPACSGFWLGLAAGAAGIRPAVTGHLAVDIPAAGLAGALGTPVAQGLLRWGLHWSRFEE